MRCGDGGRGGAAWRGRHGIDWIVSAIRPAVWASGMVGGDVVDNAARKHVRRTADVIVNQSALLHEAVDVRRVSVVGAYYDLTSGVVEFS